jgi:hypothetical protein
MLEQEESTLNLKKQTEEKHNTERFFQIDVLKTLMIFLVIFDHTIPWDIKNILGVALWERISIPIFVIIMGFNIGYSLQRDRNKRKLKPDYNGSDSFYSDNYFWKKIIRYGIPFVLLYIISTNIGALFYGGNIDLIEAGQWAGDFGPNFDIRHLFIGILPFWGPGNWFIPVIFEFIILAPWVYRGFSGSTSKAITTLIICYLVEIITQLIIFSLKNPNPPPTFSSLNAYYTAILLLYGIFPLFSAVGLGMWFSRNHDLFNKQNLFIWILVPFSLLYLIFYQFFDYHILVGNVSLITGDYNFLVFPYSAFLFLIALKILPKDSKTKLAKIIKIISKSTYHILLIQILYFGIVYALYGDHYGASIFGINHTEDIVVFLNLIINWLICVPLGILWWYTGSRIKTFVKQYIEIEQIERVYD